MLQTALQLLASYYLLQGADNFQNLGASDLPTIPDTWFGPGEARADNESIVPFEVDISSDILADLQNRLLNAVPLQPPLEGAKQWYGLNTNVLQDVVDYWSTQYNFSSRQEFFNQYPHYKTEIQGLNIHFVHVKPVNPDGLKVLPILLAHGWPGSFVEFYEIIPILTTPQEGRDFVFEVIVPSLPGFVFSDGAVRPGLGIPQVAQIFKKLMERIGFEKFYLQGGDVGSQVVQNLATLFPDSVIGVHSNLFLPTTPLAIIKLGVGAIFPHLLLSDLEIQYNYPLSKTLLSLLGETGFMHIQFTKPDTIGAALRDTPVGLAAYFLEKFSTATNKNYRDLDDAGLTEKFTYDQLLDDITLHWVTRSETTAFRIYKELLSSDDLALNLAGIPTDVPAGVSRFPYELTYPPKTILKDKFRNLVYLKDHEDGGHFAALEVPEVFATDLYEFAEAVEAF
ncbi:juvenile hormone epoxide hydrolase 2-like [Cylas formicarius]|uniref:juvenile hormone epoxide hydrolase 2-like n=1 Tax=Cylas formicarius TaxID=197179 RepID=UPI0029588A78|nr:juvenile hormone epoxide hydrolase 2-like [Cylas formicarius]